MRSVWVVLSGGHEDEPYTSQCSVCANAMVRLWVMNFQINDCIGGYVGHPVFKNSYVTDPECFEYALITCRCPGGALHLALS